MKHNKKRASANHNFRNEAETGQPKQVHNNKPGWGDKKLEGPNRPAE